MRSKKTVAKVSYPVCQCKDYHYEYNCHKFFIIFITVIIGYTYVLIGHSKSHHIDVAKEITELSKNQFNNVFDSYSKGLDL